MITEIAQIEIKPGSVRIILTLRMWSFLSGGERSP